MSQNSKTPAEWITLAQQGKEVWNREVASIADSDSDFIDFRNAEIPASVCFAGFNFPIEADFTGAKFERLVNWPVIFFIDATFQGDVTFRDAKFNCDVNFTGATFNGSVIFDQTDNKSTCFLGGASFSCCTFAGETSFRGVNFKADASFIRANFERKAVFRGAKFIGSVDLRGAKFQHFANFYDATFCGAAYFHNAIFSEPPWFKSEKVHGDVYFNSIEEFSAQFLDIKREYAETNYRQLKMAMKRIEAHPQENAFFRLEMLARKHREPWPEKGLFWLYEFASDYGQSILRPFILLALSSVGFFLLYCAFPQLLGDKNMPDDHIANALHLAMQKAFVFPGMFSGMRLELSGWGTLLAGFHWLLSAASWFLMLLGLRNRFRLK